MSRYDGVRPKHAVCPSCGYQFGGIPITHGQLTCPECAHTFSFQDMTHPSRRTPRPKLGITIGVVLLAGASIALGYSGLMYGVIVFLLGLVGLVGLRILRRAMLGSD